MCVLFCRLKECGGCSTSSQNNAAILVVDVRPPEQFAICHLPGSLNAPFKHFDKHVDTIRDRLSSSSGELTTALYVVCRRGNDSQRAVARLREVGLVDAVDMVGGMEAWGKEIDATFPLY